MNGQGKMTYKEGGVYNGEYNGEWKNNERNGNGTATDSHKNIYIGFWKDDTMNGTGIMNYFYGFKLYATWKNGTLDTSHEFDFKFKIEIGTSSYEILCNRNDNSDIKIKFLSKKVPTGYEYGTEYTYDANNHTIEPKTSSESENKDEVLDAIEEVLFKHEIITKTTIQNDKDMITELDNDIFPKDNNTTKTLPGSLSQDP
jgi:hypothetical protein